MVLQGEVGHYCKGEVIVNPCRRRRVHVLNQTQSCRLQSAVLPANALDKATEQMNLPLPLSTCRNYKYRSNQTKPYNRPVCSYKEAVAD